MQGNSPLKVLIVAGFRDSSVPSGEEVAAKLHEEGLRQHTSLAVDTLFIRKPGQENRFSQFINLIWSGQTRRLLRDKIRSFQPDIVHFHSLYPMLSFSGVFLAKKLGIKTVVTLHNVRYICAEGAYYLKGDFCARCQKRAGIDSVLKRCVQGSIIKSFFLFFTNLVFVRSGLWRHWIDHWISVSPFIQEEYHRFGLPADRLSVVGIGVPSLERVSSEAKLRKTVVFSGRVSEEKGILLFLNVCDRMPDYHFLVLGPLAGHFSQTGTLPYRPNLEWISGCSRQDALQMIYQRASVVFVPSLCSESFNLTAHEALAMGLPILTTNRGNLRDLVCDSQAGLAVDPDQPDSFVDAIGYIHSSDSSYSTYQANGLSYIQRFSDSTIAHALEKLYSQLCLKEIA